MNDEQQHLLSLLKAGNFHQVKLNRCKNAVKAASKRVSEYSLEKRAELEDHARAISAEQALSKEECIFAEIEATFKAAHEVIRELCVLALQGDRAISLRELSSCAARNQKQRLEKHLQHAESVSYSNEFIRTKVLPVVVEHVLGRGMYDTFSVTNPVYQELKMRVEKAYAS